MSEMPPILRRVIYCAIQIQNALRWKCVNAEIGLVLTEQVCFSFQRHKKNDRVWNDFHLSSLKLHVGDRTNQKSDWAFFVVVTQMLSVTIADSELTGERHRTSEWNYAQLGGCQQHLAWSVNVVCMCESFFVTRQQSSHSCQVVSFHEVWPVVLSVVHRKSRCSVRHRSRQVIRKAAAAAATTTTRHFCLETLHH